MEENTDELVKVSQTLTKENDELKVKLEEFEAKEAEVAKEAEIKKRVAEELAKLKEEEEEEKPDKEEEPESKGVVDEPAEEAPAEVKEKFIFEGNDLTMSPKYFAEFDNEVRGLEWMKEVRWIPNGVTEVNAQ